MIDASTSPVPLWRRYGTVLLLTVLVVVMGYVVYVKELHHSSPSATNPPAAVAPSGTPPAAKSQVSSPTTIPGGIPVSGRDPFAP